MPFDAPGRHRLGKIAARDGADHPADLRRRLNQIADEPIHGLDAVHPRTFGTGEGRALTRRPSLPTTLLTRRSSSVIR